jgi:hypothetical protein
LEKVFRIAVMGAALWFSLASGPGPGVPDPDSCETPGVGTLSTVELGTADEGTFSPLQSGQAVDLVFGGQGGAMVPVRLRLSGSDVPSCLAHMTEVYYDGQQIASDSVPVHTYEDDGGARSTKAMFLVLFGSEPAPGQTFEVRTTVGSTTETLELVRAEL